MLTIDELLAASAKAPAPGTPEWAAVMTASKVPALDGNSPWESYYSLWHRMAGNLPASQPDDEVLERGRVMEPTCSAWYQIRHPEHRVVNAAGRWWESPEGAATPDRIIVYPDGSVALMECKTDTKDTTADWEWEQVEDGHDTIPPAYRDQGQWLMHNTGTDHVVFAVITTGLQYREYTLHRDQGRIDELVTLVRGFRASVENGDAPGISVEDGHTATYRAVRQLHPGIEDTVAALDPSDVITYLYALADKQDAEKRLQAAKNRCANTIGDAKAGECYGRRIFNRQSRGGGTPYLVQAKNLPTVEQLVGDDQKAA